MGGFCPGGFCPRGDFVHGDFSGDFVRGGFCPTTKKKVLSKMHKIFLGEFPEVLRSPFTQDNKRDKERKRFTMYKRNRANISKVQRISSMEQPPINIRSIENFQTFKKSLKRAKESIKSVSFLKEASMITFNRTDYKYF